MLYRTGICHRCLREGVRMNGIFGQIRSKSGFFRDESGASNTEYALLAGMVSIVAVLLLSNIGVSVAGMFGDVESQY